METYARILLIAMPAFLFLVLFEKWYGYRKRKDPFRALDTISSLSSGYTNVLKDVLGLSITIISYDWFMTHFAFFKIENTIATYIIAFIALDFMGYWVHRLSHEVNLFGTNTPFIIVLKSTIWLVLCVKVFRALSISGLSSLFRQPFLECHPL